MKAFNDSKYLKQRCLEKIDIFNNSHTVTRQNSTIRYIIRNYHPSVFTKILQLPEWFENVINHIHINATNDYAVAFTRCWVSAIAVGVDVNMIRLPFLLNIMKVNHLNAVSNVALVQVFDGIKQTIGVLELVIQVEKYTLPNTPSIAQINTRNKFRKIARMSIHNTKNSLELIKKTIPRDQIYYLTAAIEALSHDTISVQRALQYTVCTDSSISVDIIANQLITLLKELTV